MMECPFCKRDIGNADAFCPHCGQAITHSTENSAFNSYWQENNTTAQKNNKAQKERAAQLATDKSKRRSATFLRLVFFVVILCTMVLYVVFKNENNEKNLATVHKSMIGEQYGDTKEGSYWVGSSLDRRVVTIVNEDTLKFVEGYYRSYKNNQGTTSWEEKEIYRTDTFSYELSISFWGDITIHFAGAEFEVYIDEDDGTVRGIDLY